MSLHEFGGEFRDAGEPEVLSPEVRLDLVWESVGDLIPTDSRIVTGVAAEDNGLSVLLSRSVEDEPRFVEAQWKTDKREPPRVVRVEQTQDLTSDESLDDLTALELSVLEAQKMPRRMPING